MYSINQAKNSGDFNFLALKKAIASLYEPKKSFWTKELAKLEKWKREYFLENNLFSSQ